MAVPASSVPSEGWVTKAVAGVLAAGALFSVVLVVREIDILRAQAALVEHAAAFARNGTASRSAYQPLDLGAPVRALLPMALMRATDVQALRDPARRAALLDEALRALDVALLRRPNWGEAELARAFVLSQRDGAQAVTTQASLARSYVDAPYLREGAAWRIGVGLDAWTALTPEAQRHWVDEAIWYMRLQPGAREQLFPLIRNSGAYQSLMLRWREVRARDSDVRRAD